MILGGVIIYGSVQLNLGSLTEPDSGFLPFLAGCSICLTAIIVFLQSFIQGERVQDKLSALWQGLRWWRPTVVLFLLLVYTLVMRKIGFLLTTFVILFMMFRVVERLSWRKTVSLSILISFLSYLLFDVFLGATLPKGIFSF